jgi:type IV secretory pathway VirB2 component (pilin)
MVTKNEGAQGEDSYSAIYTGIVAIEGYFQFERAFSLYTSLFLFPVATALLLGIVSTNRQSGDKMLF